MWMEPIEGDTFSGLQFKLYHLERVNIWSEVMVTWLSVKEKHVPCNQLMCPLSLCMYVMQDHTVAGVYPRMHWGKSKSMDLEQSFFAIFQFVSK